MGMTLTYGPFLKEKFIFISGFMSVWVDAMSAGACEARKDIGPPGAGIIGGCESLDVVVGTPWVL